MVTESEGWTDTPNESDWVMGAHPAEESQTRTGLKRWLRRLRKVNTPQIKEYAADASAVNKPVKWMMGVSACLRASCFSGFEIIRQGRTPRRRKQIEK